MRCNARAAQRFLSNPTLDEHIDWACSTALERLGVATVKELAGFWNAVTSAQAKAWCQDAAKAGRVVPAMVSDHNTGTKEPRWAAFDWERRLAERAARAGQDVASYLHHLIDRDIDLESLDAILAPMRRNFEESGMTDDDLAALVEEVREDIWREKHGRPSKAS